ncbi:SDR family NAD(P)-dependent oxidoreductase [Streptomyces sp. MN13]
MDLNGARVPVAGATGVHGGALTAEPAGRGPRPALAGRDPARPARAAEACPGAPPLALDAHDPRSCARAAHGTAAATGGLAAVVAVFGPVASGRATEAGDEVAEDLTAADALVSAALSARTAGARARGIGPGHPDTGSARRAVAGTPPPTPVGRGPRRTAVAVAVADAMDADAELPCPAPDQEPVVGRRVR